MEGGKNRLIDSYYKVYKRFLFIPFIVLVIALVMIGTKFSQDGDFINKDISLKGGISLTIIDSTDIDENDMQKALAGEFTPNEVAIRQLKSTGQSIGFIIESDKPELSAGELDSILDIVGNKLGKEITKDKYSFETMGSSLGDSFFNQTIRALIIAFIFMGLVVFLYFRSFVPSTAVILSALSDIVVTVATINLLGIKLGTAGIAALLMLVGYSIDTDIMLTTRVLKRKENSIKEAIGGAFKTGMTMTITTLAAVSVALFFSQSEVIKQIMTILLIGLVIDIMNTWIQNAGLLLWYVEKKKK